MKRQIIRIVLIAGLFLSIRGVVFAADVNLTIRDGANIIYTSSVSLQPAGTIQIQGHNLDANSVLSVLNDADILSDSFTITDLQYYDSMGSFYLKCINTECDNWQYTVDNSYPWESIDQKILSGGENVYIYFGPQNKILLSSNSITTNDTLTITAQKYDYENDAWITRTGVTVGLTQPDPNNPWTPIEIQTNSVDASGQAVFSSIPAGSYNVGIKEDFYFPTETLTITTPPEPTRRSSGGSNRSIVVLNPIKPIFDAKKAFEFLIAQQKENGSFDENLYTDWAALALASGNYQGEVIKLIKYLGESKIESPLLTDYERRAMALMSLGLNPYNTNGENYIEKIIASFDGKQFGDVSEDNDDIFALIVLQNAGYNQDEKMIADAITFILNRQKENGSWDESIDMTGASMTALSIFNQNEQIKNTLIKAKEFLKQNQKDDGGWRNVSSTAWALEGVIAMNEKPEDWIKNPDYGGTGGNTPLDYLATMQDADGGIKNEYLKNKIWETAYVTSVLSGKNWNQIMQKFEKPEITFEKPKITTTTKTSKKIIKKQKLEAAAINAITSETAPAITENPKKNWFTRFWNKIFSVF